MAELVNLKDFDANFATYKNEMQIVHRTLRDPRLFAALDPTSQMALQHLTIALEKLGDGLGTLVHYNRASTYAPGPQQPPVRPR